MQELSMSKIVAVFIVVLFVGMIASSAFSGGGKKDIQINNYGLLDITPSEGKGVLYLKLSNDVDETKDIEIILKLNDEEINSTQLTLQGNEEIETTFDFSFFRQSDNLVFLIKNEEGNTIWEGGHAIGNYPPAY